MLGSFVLYLGVGRLLIYAGQKFIQSNIKNEFFKRLFECDFCLGVWVYTILALVFKIKILSDVIPYFPFVSELIAGVASSFIMHLIVLGWKTKFETIIID